MEKSTTGLTPKKYQLEGVQFLTYKKYALLADDVGLGKSMQALLARPPTWHKVLIICTASTKDGWKKQIELWLSGGRYFPPPTQIINTARDTMKTDQHFYIVNYDLIARKDKKIFHKLMRMKFHLMICDEAHKLKNTRAHRTRRVLDPRGLISRTERLWYLTATPIKNRVIDLYSLVSSTMPELIAPYDTYLKFAYRFCDAYEGKYGLEVGGSSNELDLKNRLAPFMLRREEEDVEDQLPKAILEIINLECTKEAEKLIYEEELKTVEIAGERDIELFGLGEQARIRQVLAKYKLKEVLPYIKDLLEETPKLLIFFHHKSIRESLVKSLSKENPVYIDGTVPVLKRAGIVEQFDTSPSCRVFLGQTQACGEGLDGLQHSCHTCVFIEPSWSPTDIAQCIGRLKRLGQKRMVRAYIIVIKSTLEAKMMGTAQWKEKIMNKIIKTGEKTMSIEQSLEGISKSLATIVGMLDKNVNGAAAPAKAAPAKPGKPAAPAKPGKPATTARPGATAAPAKPGKPAAPAKPGKPAVAAEAAESVAGLDQVRVLAAEVCKKFPGGVGKERCQTIIAALGGTKLDTLDEAGLAACSAQFEEVLAEPEDESGDI